MKPAGRKGGDRVCGVRADGHRASRGTCRTGTVSDPACHATVVYGESPSRFTTTVAAAAVGGFVFASSVPVASAEPATPCAGAELRLGTRLVDDECPTIELKLMEFTDGSLSVFLSGHLHERKATGPSCGHVAHDADCLDRAHAAEQSGQLLVRGAVGKVANIEPTTHTSVVSWHCARTTLERSRSRARASPFMGRLLVPARWGDISDTGTTRVFLLDGGSIPELLRSQPFSKPFVSTSTETLSKYAAKAHTQRSEILGSAVFDSLVRHFVTPTRPHAS